MDFVSGYQTTVATLEEAKNEALQKIMQDNYYDLEKYFDLSNN